MKVGEDRLRVGGGLQMIGFLKPTAGTAYIQGMNILTEMDRIYACMGVCPQHEYVPCPCLLSSFRASLSLQWLFIIKYGRK